MTIRIFVTGGTFDKEYDEITGKLFFKKTHLSEMLKLGRCGISCEVETLMMKDSLEMTEDDRTLILEKCKEVKEDQILITHGTDTLVETARVLGTTIRDKTIVLTGAMIPYKFGSSDGLFNLGSSLAFVSILPHGVYVSMNGKCFMWNAARKNRQTGRFEQVD